MIWPPGDGHGQVLTLALALGAATGATAVLPGMSRDLSAQSGRSIQRDATSRLFTAVTGLSGLRTVEDPAFQDKIRFAQQAGASGPGQVLSGGIAIVQSAVTLAGFLIALVVLSPLLAVIVTAAAVPAVYLQRGTARREAAVLRGITHAQRRQFFFASLLSGVTAAKEIRLFGLGPFFRARMLDELTEAQRAGTQVDRRVLAVDGALAVIGAAVAAGGLLWATSAAAGRPSIGDLAMLVAALAATSATLGSMISGGAFTYQALLMFESYREVLSALVDLPVPDQPRRPAAPGDEIDDVWFRYGPGTAWVLRGVSFFIAGGQATALVGLNGAGRAPGQAAVPVLRPRWRPDLWDGTDLRDMDPAELRERLSVVFQDYATYDLTAAENVAVGDLGRAAQLDLLHAAARQAGIHDTLAAAEGLPDAADPDLLRPGGQGEPGNRPAIRRPAAASRAGRRLPARRPRPHDHG